MFHGMQKMVLLKYISVSNPLKKKELHNPDGPLVRIHLMPSTTIDAANTAIHEIFPTIDECGTYVATKHLFIAIVKASIASYIICMQSSYTVN